MIKEKNLVETLVNYVEFLGIKNISKIDGIWENKIDDTWTIKCNGHKDVVDGIPPFHFYIEYNGWPGGFVSLFDGSGLLLHGEYGNEGALSAAIEKRMSQPK